MDRSIIRTKKNLNKLTEKTNATSRNQSSLLFYHYVIICLSLVMSYSQYGVQHKHTREEKNSQKISKIKQTHQNATNPLEVKVHARTIILRTFQQLTFCIF